MSDLTPAQQAEKALIQLLKDMDRWVDSLPIQRAGSSRLTQNAMPYIAALRAAVSPQAQPNDERWCLECDRPADSVCAFYKHKTEQKWPNGVGGRS